MPLPKSISQQRMRLLESVSPIKIPSPSIGKVIAFPERHGRSGEDKTRTSPLQDREVVLAAEKINGCWESDNSICCHTPLPLS